MINYNCQKAERRKTQMEKNLKPQNAKNCLILYTREECDEPKERVELWNVESFEHQFVNGRSYLRVCCDGRFYYFKTQLTAISSFVSYQR